MDALDPTPRFTRLAVIDNPKGVILRGIKASDSTFNGFGEAYFTTIHENETKGWKKHRRMHMSLIVPQGTVEFHVHWEQTRTTHTFLLGSTNYGLLSVPPGFWVAFSGRSPGTNLILNIASIEHDPQESVNADLSAFPYQDTN